MNKWIKERRRKGRKDKIIMENNENKYIYKEKEWIVSST